MTDSNSNFKPSQEVSGKSWSTLVFSALRVAIGLLWAVLAAQTWTHSFVMHLHHYGEAAFQNLSGGLVPWFGTWVSLIAPAPDLFGGLARFFVTLIAVFLIIGFARKTTYIVGAIIALPLWTLMQGYSSAHTLGSINLGAALTYILIFISLILVERREGTTPYSVDYYLGHAWPGWRHVSECASDEQLRQQIKPLPWIEQVPVIVIIAVVLAFLISGSTSSIIVGSVQTFGPLENVYMRPSMYDYPGSSGAPMSASDHMSSPLNVAGQSAVEFANPAVLPPLIGTGKTVDIHMDATDQTVEIAGGINYEAWTFNKTAPGPIIHVRQGQMVNITLTNHSRMPHSLDLHAAEVAPNVNYANINFGETLHTTFVAKVPGAFIYHCGTPPVLWHMANGMYGVIVVDPKVPLPRADKSYVLIQSEWYTRLISGATYTGDFSKMLARTPDLVTFNGKAFQYKAHPLPARAGKLVRIYFVNAGPDMWSSFHVIGGIFKKVYPGGDPKQAISGVSTYSVSPGAGAIFDIVMPMPGHYAFVDHDMSAMEKGAVGVFDVQ